MGGFVRCSALLGMMMLHGCAKDAIRPDRTSVRDSAGVQIAENILDGEPLPEWSLSDGPVLEIGVVEGDSAYQLFRVSGVLRLSDGRVIVANAGTNELRMYSNLGEHLRTVGGSGEGPGEYRGMRQMWLLGSDSLLVEDFLNARLTFYTEDLELTGSRPLRELAPYVTPPPLGRFSDGRWVVRTSRTVGEPPEPVEFVGLLVTYGEHSASADTISELPTTPGYFERCGPDRSAICRLRAPFAPSLSVVLAGDTVFVGNGADFTVKVINDKGELAALWRGLAPSRRVTPDDIDHDRRATLELARTDNQRRMIERSYETIPIPETMPAYSNLVVDSAGYLWVQEYQAAQDTTSYYFVFARDGAVVARVAIPGDLKIHQIGKEYIVGVRMDEADVEYVNVYRLRREGQ